jgi:excisionase family DNA binding protein
MSSMTRMASSSSRRAAAPDVFQGVGDLAEHAVYFAISTRTFYRLLDEGHLQATRIRGCVRVSAEEIRRFEEILVETEHYRK